MANFYRCHFGLLLLLLDCQEWSRGQQDWAAPEQWTVQNRTEEWTATLGQFLFQMRTTMADLTSKVENLETKMAALVDCLNHSRDAADLNHSRPAAEAEQTQSFGADLSQKIELLESSVLEQAAEIEKLEGSIGDLVRASSEPRNRSACRSESAQMALLAAWNQNFLQEYRLDVQRLLFNRDCEDFRRKGSVTSGVYLIYPLEGAGDPVRVYCDMEADNGGWTVVQRRGKFGSGVRLNFHRDWAAYKIGFGDPDREFWLGNEAVHQLTARAAKGFSLRVELHNSRNGSVWTALYRRFRLGSEDEGYVLHLGSYRGNATDGLYPHHGRPFRTWDKEEDPLARACAWLDRSGWWHHPVEVARPFRHWICSYPGSGTDLNSPYVDSAPELHSQVMTLQPPPGQPANHTNTFAFLHLGALYWMDKDGRHFDRVEMKIRPNL